MTKGNCIALLGALLATLPGAGCGPDHGELDLVQVELALAIDFESDDQLEVSVFQETTAACPGIDGTNVDALDPREGRQQASAAGLNDGSVSLSFDDLPAEVPLAFFGRVKRPGEGDLAEDCADGVVISEGTNASISLVLVAP